MGDYTLGLDIGSKSIGWALIEDGRKKGITAIGVRVFPEGVDRDTKGAEVSKSAGRREARGARRCKQRRRRRREKLVKLLRQAGALPESDEGLEELLQKDPYELRRRGLDEKLSLQEFGRALYHLNQRRGFKSNRKSGKEKEDGVVKKEAGALQKAVIDAGGRTVGEYLARLNPEEQRRRERYTFRTMYEEEFNLLWDKQAEFYRTYLTGELKKKVGEETIFYQRPLKAADHLIGDCELEKGEKRCPRGDWYARRFRLLQDVNNLRVQNADGSEETLTYEQREKLLDGLGKRAEITFDQARDLLELMETQKFNLEASGKIKRLKGDTFNSGMSKVLGVKRWGAMAEEEKVSLNEACIELEDDELYELLRESYGLEENEIEKVFKIALPQKYMSFSRKAIRKLLEYMEEGAMTHEAIKAVYGDGEKRAGETVNELPLPEDLRNPLVNRALNEVRKLVNAIIGEYGKPERIKIEMAKEVKGSAKEREEMHWRVLENEKRNSEVREKLIAEYGMAKATRDDVIKYKLWEECGHACPYTGKAIAQHQLFGEHPEFQIEHILPYSRSLDDSYMNKTLCCVDENKRKGKRTPYEFYEGTEHYEKIKQRIACLPYPKRRKFLQKEVELDECIERELNDTRYITKEVVRYLRQLGVKVSGTKGKVTSELRHCWGLNSILDGSGMGLKNRDDHRHHAIDAAVVAVTKNEHLRELAQTKYAVGDVSFKEPWEGFRKELEGKVSGIVVSHKASKRVRGQLHEETSYGPTGRKDEKGQDVYVYRKKVEDLTGAMVNKIVDRVVRAIVTERFLKHGIDPEKNRDKAPKGIWEEPLYMKSIKGKKVPIKKVRLESVSNNMILLNDEDGSPYRGVEPKKKHHIEVFEYSKDGGKMVRKGRIISLLEAVQRIKGGRAVVQKDYGDGGKFLFSLATNEMFMLEVDGGEVPHRVQYITELPSGPRIVFRPHTYAGKVAETDPVPLVQRKSPNTLRGYKVHVDRLGRVYKAND